MIRLRCVRRVAGASTLLLLAAAAACGGGGGGGGTSRSGERADGPPNIVFILLDDLDATTSPYWDAMPETRELIAGRGTTFTNSFANNPVCCPARASVLTGKYSHNNQVWDATGDDGGYATFRATGSERDTVATRLDDHGYTTGFVGKYLNGYEETPEAVPPGWDEWFGLAGSFLDGHGYSANHNGTMEQYGDADDDYQTDVLSRQASRFVDGTESDDDQPFFLFLSPSAPHDSIDAAPAIARTSSAMQTSSSFLTTTKPTCPTRSRGTRSATRRSAPKAPPHSPSGTAGTWAPCWRSTT